MALSNALYKSQDEAERDLTDGPGWTIDDQKPGFFANALEAIPRGLGQGAADGISVLTHGLQFGGQKSPMDAVMDGPLAAQQATQEMVTGKKTEESPWKQSWDAGAAQLEADTRDYAKSLIPDPRITGAGANIIQGFSKAVTEFSVGSAAGGPLAGAGLLGASEGYAHYQDLRDQGVDEDTAKRSGLLEALTAGGSALLPMGMPARWLKGLALPGTLLAQAGAGAVINTSFGAASRYASAKILDDAGYHEQAEQQKPWDETNILTDAIAGLFFGAHAGWHGLKAADVDPSVRDAAKTVQDRQEVNERAPGVPVDMRSAAVHRQSLETALGDLMADRPVDLSKIDTDGATFARPEIDESQAHAIMREEFEKSGVLDEAADFDRWLAGEPQREPKEVTTEQPIRMYHGGEIEGEGADRWYTQSLEDAKGWAGEGGAIHYVDVPPGHAAYERLRGDAANGIAPDSRMPLSADLDAQRKPLGAEAPQLHPGILADRPDLQIVNEHGEALHAGDEQTKAVEAEAQANKEADPMFKAAVECEARHA